MVSECVRKLLSRLAPPPHPAGCPGILPAQFLSRPQIFRPASDASERDPLDTSSYRGLPSSGSNLSCSVSTPSQSSLRPTSLLRPRLFHWLAQPARLPL